MVAIAAQPRTVSAERAIATWLFFCCAMIFAMVLIGGITRLTESGLSITEWQPIEGVLPPLNAADWNDAFARYRAIPQYLAVHPDMTLAQFKSIYFWEYFHRLWGRLIGVAFLVPFLYFLARGMVTRALAPKLAALFVLGGLQGALGWYMVESGLANRIEVSQYRLAAHLAMAVIIYLAMLWVALDLLTSSSSFPRPSTGSGRESRAELDPRFRGGDDNKKARNNAKWLRRGAGIVLGLVFVTLVAGAFVAGTRAGYIDNTFPLMEQHFVPPDYWHLAPWWRNWFENLASVQFDHRVLAETTWLAIAVLWLSSLRAKLAPSARWALHALFAAACLQVALGIATLLTVVWLPLAVAHQGGALLLITAALVAQHSLKA
ncbi:MAG: COX15/CtaA family protein [Stellaceae bacterium]